MKFAFQILIHKNLEQFKRLFRAIYSPQDYYLVHVDKKAGPLFREEVRTFLSGYSNCELMPSLRVTWAGYSIVDVELRGMKRLLELATDWDYYHNLSGQDFPLKRREEMVEFLTRHRGMNFMELCDLEVEKPNFLWHRFHRVHLELFGKIYRVPKIRRYRLGFHPWQGECWLTAHRSFCEYATSAKTRFYRLFFRTTIVPDESYFQTVLMNSPFRTRVVNNSLRYIRWIKGADHPLTLTMEDLSAMLSSDAFFARKFEPEAPVLSALEERLAVPAV